MKCPRFPARELDAQQTFRNFKPERQPRSNSALLDQDGCARTQDRSSRPLAEAVPPRLYGGTERVVSWLTEELVELGHHVTLFASGDSLTSADLEAATPVALRLARDHRDPMLAYAVLLAKIAEKSGEFNVIHCHVDWQHIPLLQKAKAPFLTTLHGRLDLPDLERAIQCFDQAPFVSDPDFQRDPLPLANWIGNCSTMECRNAFSDRARTSRLPCLPGRITPKGPKSRYGWRRQRACLLKIAAKIEDADADYFQSCVKPLLDGTRVWSSLARSAKATRMISRRRDRSAVSDTARTVRAGDIEAMACGTPVIAFRRGSVAEVLEQGLSGFIVDPADEQGALDALGRLIRLTAVRSERLLSALHRPTNGRGLS